MTLFPPISAEKKQLVLTNADNLVQLQLAIRGEGLIRLVLIVELGKISVKILINFYHHTTKVIFIEYTIIPHYLFSMIKALFIVFSLILV